MGRKQRLAAIELMLIVACWASICEQYKAFGSSNFLLNSMSSNRTLIRHRRSFVCPGDGKWPDDTDCGK